MFQQYPQKALHEPIVLHEDQFQVRWGDRLAQGEGSACFIWLPSPGIEIEVETAARGIDSDSVTLELPGFKTDNVVVHSVHVVPSSTRGSKRRLGVFVSKMDSGCEQDVVSVGFQVVNFTDFFTLGLLATPGDPTVITSVEQGLVNGDTSAGRPVGSVLSSTRAATTLSHGGWLVNLVAVSDADEVYKKLKARGGYVFTHVGQLTRMDGAMFAVHQAERILDSVTAFLSFARGAACGLPIRWGRCATGEIVWRHFRSPIVDGWETPISWFDSKHGELLHELFDPFCQMHNDEEHRDALLLALNWYRHCNTQSSGVEGSLVLGMAALDLLGALIVVGQNQATSAAKYDGYSAAKKLRVLLQALDVPVCIPHQFEALTRFAAKHGKSDSCEALAALRNGFVHSNEKRRKIVFEASGREATFEAWWLSLWYQELALLYLLGHQGSYRNRTTNGWVGQIESVPWSGRSASTSTALGGK